MCGVGEYGLDKIRSSEQINSVVFSIDFFDPKKRWLVGLCARADKTVTCLCTHKRFLCTIFHQTLVSDFSKTLLPQYLTARLVWGRRRE